MPSWFISLLNTNNYFKKNVFKIINFWWNKCTLSTFAKVRMYSSALSLLQLCWGGDYFVLPCRWLEDSCEKIKKALLRKTILQNYAQNLLFFPCTYMQIMQLGKMFKLREPWLEKNLHLLKFWSLSLSHTNRWDCPASFSSSSSSSSSYCLSATWWLFFLSNDSWFPFVITWTVRQEVRGAGGPTTPAVSISFGTLLRVFPRELLHRIRQRHWTATTALTPQTDLKKLRACHQNQFIWKHD